MIVNTTVPPIGERVAGVVRAEAAYQRVKASELAKVLGLSPQSMGLRLRGEVPFTMDELFQIAQALGVTTSQLIARAEQRASEAAA